MTIKKENLPYFKIRVSGKEQDKFVEVMKKRLAELDDDNSRKE